MIRNRNCNYQIIGDNQKRNNVNNGKKNNKKDVKMKS